MKSSKYRSPRFAELGSVPAAKCCLIASVSPSIAASWIEISGGVGLPQPVIKTATIEKMICGFISFCGFAYQPVSQSASCWFCLVREGDGD